MIYGNTILTKDKISNIGPSLFKIARQVFLKNEQLLVSYLKEERFTGGTTDSKLAVRSGKLRASVRPMPIVNKPTSIEGGVKFGTIYARVHVGPAGQVTTIRPKKGKYLAIPLPAALKPSGVAKGAPRTGPWGDTFFAHSKKGNLILFGKSIYSKGARQGETRGKVTPLFLMVKQVKIKARIHPKEIIKWIAPKVIADFRSLGIQISKE
jgi:hypothetical protein